MILVVNAGSSSIKLALFDAGLVECLSGSVTEIGGKGRLRIGARDEDCAFADHEAALTACLNAMAGEGHQLSGISAAAHRVVHGGRALTAPCRITPEAIEQIEVCAPLAPLHNPHNLAGIRAISKLAPDLPQFASFDTAFHTTNPDVALRYAIPDAEDAKGLRRYGFHGISYADIVARLPGVSGGPLPSRVLALHLGNGASLCAIRDGRSVATTMGYSPLEGLTMGTRSGSIDANAVLRLAADHGIEGAARLLNHESGLLALGGASDMRTLGKAGTDASRFAIAHFCYWAMRHSGSMIAALGGLDAVVFTGGIGENDHRVRAGILSGLAWLGIEVDGLANRQNATRLHDEGSDVAVWILPAEEERRIAGDALALGKEMKDGA